MTDKKNNFKIGNRNIYLDLGQMTYKYFYTGLIYFKIIHGADEIVRAVNCLNVIG